MKTTWKSYPSDVSDGEWVFLLPNLTLIREDAPQRAHALREVFNALRYVVRTGCQWRMLPHDSHEWTVAYQQAPRWVQAGVFEKVSHDLRIVLRLVDDREAEPSATILDGRTLQSTPESGQRAGYDGAKKKNGSKYMRPWIRWKICWLWRSRRPTNKSELGWRFGGEAAKSHEWDRGDRVCRSG
jgi:transposase